MVLNKKISDSIDQWHVEFDLNGFVHDEHWLKNADRTEDILQLRHVFGDGPVLDVGYYGDRYRIYLIYDMDWDHPAEVFESTDPEVVANMVYEFMDKYATG